MADLPFELADPGLAGQLLGSLDVEGKIARAIEAVGPMGGRDVVLLGGGSTRAGQLEALGARLVLAADPAALDRLPAESADVVVGFWSSLRADAEFRDDDLRAAQRVLRHDGHLLAVHDYGRDDVAGLLGDRPEYSSWSRRDGWFLGNGFRIRVVHAFWTFDSMDILRAFLGPAFGERGTALGATLTRPRLRYNVAVYHRTKIGR